MEVFSSVRSDPSGFLRLAPERLRFSLGTSLVDLAVPVEVTGDARALVHGAAQEAALLVASLHRDLLGAAATDRLILREEFATLPTPNPQLGPPPGNPDLRTAAQMAPAVHPALWGGLVGAWMGKGGRGRSLVALFIELLRRAFAEMRTSRAEEPTPYLVALVLAAEAAGAERAVRDVLPPAPFDRWVAAAAMAAVWIAARTGLARAWRDAGLKVGDPLLARIEAVLSPGAIAGTHGAAASGGLAVYGCELTAGVPGGDEMAQRLAEGLDGSLVLAEVEDRIRGDATVARLAEEAVAAARLRERLGEAIVRLEADGMGPSLEPARRRFAAPGGMAALVQDESERRAFAEELGGLGRKGTEGPMAPIARSLERWRDRDPAGSAGLDRAGAHLVYADAATAWLCDVAMDRLAAQARRHVAFRTGREAEGGAQGEWEAGRLYRLSPRAGAILQERVERPVGHLFADVKDFTRRTGLLGQASMAEFLRKEFYTPILVIAKEHFTGMTHLADKGGVAVNNLLGDAISLTGGIRAMVAIARGIRSHLAGLASRLTREISGEAVSRQIAAIEAAHAEAAERAATSLRTYEEALAREAPGSARHAALAIRVARARAEESRVAGERDRALARARGEVLEAGVFVSYGPAPVVVSIDDEIFGVNRVAVAEKINESARGTARAPVARARADSGLVRERERRGAKGIVHAWSVFLGQPLAVAISPDLEDAAVRLLRAGDGAGAMRTLSPPVREALESAARAAGAERPGDVYNGGAALSEEALQAFLADVEGERTVRRVELEPESVPDALRSRWYFGDEPLSLVACFGPDSRVAELFRRVGPAAFKGMAGVTIWELCAEDGGPGALCDALGASWLGKGR